MLVIRIRAVTEIVSPLHLDPASLDVVNKFIHVCVTSAGVTTSVGCLCAKGPSGRTFCKGTPPRLDGLAYRRSAGAHHGFMAQVRMNSCSASGNALQERIVLPKDASQYSMWSSKIPL